MNIYKKYLTEKYKNLFSSDREKKMMYANEVYDMITKSYAKIGGIKGSGFRSAMDMVNEIPMWKLAFTKGKLSAVILYKDKGTGRKLVAIGSDGTSNGKKRLKESFNHEFKRSFAEVSGPLLQWLIRNFPDIVNKYKIPSDEAKNYIKGKITPDKNDLYFYKRLIGGDMHEKMLIGTPGKSLPAHKNDRAIIIKTHPSK